MATSFLNGAEVTNLVMRARRIKESDKVFSDIVDERGNYYVDLVQQGGGVLGIGLVGYCYILEQAGIRFYSLAGTSVGAVNALLMAGLADVGEPVSVKVVTALTQKKLVDFVDGPRGIRQLIQKIIEGENGVWWSALWNSCQIYCLLKNKLGLNPGKNMGHWLTALLAERCIMSYADLKQHRHRLPPLKDRLEKKREIAPPKLAFITSEITTHTRVEFPRMAELYWADPEVVSPVSFVHASMAVPYFYYPYLVKNLPCAGEKANANWRKFAGYHGPVPPSVKFVDGGLLSNFPIDVFHVGHMPMKPTFGARLSTFRETYSQTNSFFNFSGAMLQTMRQIHDYEVILKNPDYKQLICNIDADQEFNWLDFKMSPKRQKQLFLLGMRKGLAFLKQFDWEYYKNTRYRLHSELRV